MNNEVYECIIQDHNICIFKFKDIQQVSDALLSKHLDIFCKSLKTVSHFQKNTVIILDCTLVINAKFVKKFFKVGITQLKQLERGYIEKLFIISSSKIIIAAGTLIVKMKKATNYTTMVSTIEEAYKLLCVK